VSNPYWIHNFNSDTRQLFCTELLIPSFPLNPNYAVVQQPIRRSWPAALDSSDFATPASNSPCKANPSLGIGHILCKLTSGPPRMNASIPFIDVFKEGCGQIGLASSICLLHFVCDWCFCCMLGSVGFGLAILLQGCSRSSSY